ncbi:TolC family protein [Fusibacter sp. 3D3]|uniref:TolC family protein n=1 Tax=Fusibacter sp. 3D3 TaxID=1048380 RepID=UPI000852B664|nr:TolC family protein [Fusibacter sp. 3D3]GAU79256.1 hypothetical protein F3D3_3915 [Fusibacter sp. 3D3]
MKFRKRKKRISLILISLLLLSIPVSFVSAEESQKTDADQVETVNLVELRALFIEDSADIRKLNDFIGQIDDALYAFEKNKKLIYYFGERLTNGYPEDRKGRYYEYYYKYFVAIENAKAKRESLFILRDLAEAKLGFGADQLLSGRALLQEKIDLYNKMIDRTELIYKTTLDKKAQGLLTKYDLEYARIVLENTKLNRDQLENQLDSLEAQIISMTNLDSDKTYKFPKPIFTETDFVQENLPQYYEQALSTSLTIADVKRQMEALEYEEDFIMTYQRDVLKTDLLDFNKRMEDGKKAQEDAKRDVYKLLVEHLNDYNHVVDEIDVINLQIEYDQNRLNTLKIMEEQGQVIDTDRLGYELKCFQSRLQKMSLENERMLLGQKIQIMIGSGINL